jgi:hypothetical protein
MKIRLHIERLVLEGLPVNGRDRSRVRAAVTAELHRLIAAHGVSDGFRSGGAVPAVRAGDFHFEAGSSPAQMGTRIARSVYGGLGGSE